MSHELQVKSDVHNSKGNIKNSQCANMNDVAVLLADKSTKIRLSDINAEQRNWIARIRSSFLCFLGLALVNNFR